MGTVAIRALAVKKSPDFVNELAEEFSHLVILIPSST
jgi:hypothetical protein